MKHGSFSQKGGTRQPWLLNIMENNLNEASSESIDFRDLASTDSLADLLVKEDENCRNSGNAEDSDFAMKVKIPWAPYIFGGVAGLTSFAYGFGSGIISVALVEIKKEWAVSSFVLTFIVTSMLGGAVLGSLLPGWLGSDRIGRKPMLVITNFVLLVGAVGSYASSTGFALICARVVVGVGVGLGSIIPSLYITEMAPTKIRGTLGILNQFSGFLGILASYCTGLLFAAEQWQEMFLIAGGVAGVAMGFAAGFLPESPRWLISHKRKREGLVSLGRIYGGGNRLHFTEEFEKISTHLSQPRTASAHPLPPKTLFTIVALQFIQQAAGSGFITYYSTSIFESWDLHGRRSIAATVLSAIPQIFVFAIVARWAEGWGRKRLLLASEAAMAIVLVYLAIITHLCFSPGTSDNNSSFKAALIFIGLAAHRVAYAFGLAPVPTVLIAEILPFHLRSHGLALSLTLNWMLNFCVTSTIPLLGSALPSVYLGMAALALIGLFYISRNISETRGILLEAAEEVHLFPVIPANPNAIQKRRRGKIIIQDNNNNNNNDDEEDNHTQIQIDSKPLQPPPILDL